MRARQSGGKGKTGRYIQALSARWESQISVIRTMMVIVMRPNASRPVGFGISP